MRINGLKLGNRFKGAGVTEASAWGMNHISLFPLGKKGLEGTVPLFKDNALSYSASSFSLHLPALSLGGTLGRQGPGNSARWERACVPAPETAGEAVLTSRDARTKTTRVPRQPHPCLGPGSLRRAPGEGGQGLSREPAAPVGRGLLGPAGTRAGRKVPAPL